MSLALVRDLVDAVDAYATAETANAMRDAARALYRARLGVLDAMESCEKDAPWPAILRMMLLLALAALDAKNQGERRGLLRGVAQSLCEAWRGDLGDIEGPQAPPAPIRQYAEG